MPGSFGNFYGTFGDQIVQADLRPTAFSGTDRWVGLIARYRDDANYHYVTLRNSGRLDIRRLVNGSIQTLSTVPFTVQPNVTYRVRFEAIGTRLRVYVNGTLRAEATDASLTRAVSSAGFATFKAALDVDNFSVVQP
jgi:pectate lyase